MAKGGKSSASSATRKKHAAKKAGAHGHDEPAVTIPKDKKLTKQQRAQKKKEPRVKSYIPPVKPAPVQPDPLETTGLVHRLPPELLIVLRSFNKKAEVTKIRALEELQFAWIDKSRKEGEDGALVYVLIDMLPVWFHHVPALFVHPSRRVRLLAAGVHLSFVQISPIRHHILSFLRDSASATQLECILGTWCLAAHDIEKQVAMTALKSWVEAIGLVSGQEDKVHLDGDNLSSLVAFIQRAILDPNGVYTYLNPAPPVAPSPPTKKGIRKEEPETTRSKAEESEESDTDRKARLRIGGFGAIRRIVETLPNALSDEILDFFKNPALWSSLYHAEQCPFFDIDSFGHSQPNVRKSAWGLILSLLSAPKPQMESLVPLLSVAVLRSAWVDPDPTVHAVMWQPLLKFLKGKSVSEFPRAWEVERTHDYSKDEDEEDEDEEASDAEAEKPSSSPSTRQSVAYQEFLQFLEHGCSGSPLQGYPTVVIIVSTIPSSILASSSSEPPIDGLFNSFWKVLDSRALSSLQRSATSAAFLSSLFECLVFIVKRIRNDAQHDDQAPAALLGSGNVDDLTETLVSNHLAKAWSHLADGTLKVEQRAAARLVSQTLLSLQEIRPALSQAAWATLSSRFANAAESNPVLLSVFLKVFHDKFKHVPELRASVAEVMSSTLRTAVQTCSGSVVVISSSAESINASSVGGNTFLIQMLDQFREGLFDDASFTELIDDLASQHAFTLLQASPALLLAYLTHRKNESRCLLAWHALLSGLAQHPDKAELSIAPILAATQRGVLPQYLKPSAREVDDLFDVLLAQALAGDVAQLPFVQQVLQSPDYFLSPEGYTASLDNISFTFSRRVDSALQAGEVELSSFEPLLALVSTLSRNQPKDLPQFKFDAVLCDIFIFGYLLPACYESGQSHATFGLAVTLWEELHKELSAESRAEVVQQINTKLGVIMCSTSLQPSPEDIIEMLWTKPFGMDVVLPKDIFPSIQELDKSLEQLSPDPIHPSLAVLNPLIPPSSTFTESKTANTFDRRGFSSYARVISALLQVFVEDRQLSKNNLWALRHFQALELYAQDFISVPSANSEVFAPEAIHANLETLVSKVEQLTTYVLTSSAEGWRQSALAVALGEKASPAPAGLATFLADTIQQSRSSNNARDSRILRNVLQHVFHDVDREEAERWMLLARRVEATSPETTMAIVFAISNFAPEPTRLDRYRNELAASLLGIPPTKANVEGLLALRKLSASAPNPDSDVVFLPQPRAVNITKACQQWITSDEDIEEDVISAITLILYHLAPILQDISGAHWELVFDIMENNLEESSLSDDESLVILARTLHLVILVQDLAATNKSLRAAWEERKMPILTIVRDLATVTLDDLKPSIPRSNCRSLLLSIIQNLPQTLINQDTFTKMCHLVTDPSIEVQKAAYRFLAIAAQKRTEYLVIEAGVDSEGTVDTQLPQGLLHILQQSNVIEDVTLESSNVFGYLLGWMLLFDLFHGSSLKVRSSYIEQLRNLDVIVAYFIPTILSILRLDQGPQKAFKLDIWAVDEFHVEYYETKSKFSLQVLAAHLYYRALLTLPSLIHTWVSDCKDRQLFSSITNYTSQCFSPVIIHTELAHVKNPESISLLVDENFSVKVASSVNEVIASYSVDEHQLEIKLKIPTDWPLHKIEIKDLKRVGVDENRWRAWILAIQQIIWSHNGRIVDGLGLFKKNVTLHFEGQVECAICYSIISVMDGTLPRKPCKTCKNRFHAGCLFKWFNTSHSSSCPLCRSDIF